jgi:hypothetical protein
MNGDVQYIIAISWHLGTLRSSADKVHGHVSAGPPM